MNKQEDARTKEEQKEVKKYTFAITGTRFGMTPAQKSIFTGLVSNQIYRNKPVIYKHGDCIGVDENAHNIIINTRNMFSSSTTRIQIHPPIKNIFRANCLINCEFDHINKPEEYLKRNHTMVDLSSRLYAFPETEKEERLSGTWATIRYARENEAKVMIVTRNGEIKN